MKGRDVKIEYIIAVWQNAVRIKKDIQEKQDEEKSK
jgi:hypothetical protein